VPPEGGGGGLVLAETLVSPGRQWPGFCLVGFAGSPAGRERRLGAVGGGRWASCWVSEGAIHGGGLFLL
jgi:hypothetical protein